MDKQELEKLLAEQKSLKEEITKRQQELESYTELVSEAQKQFSESVEGQWEGYKEFFVSLQKDLLQRVQTVDTERLPTLLEETQSAVEMGTVFSPEIQQYMKLSEWLINLHIIYPKVSTKQERITYRTNLFRDLKNLVEQKQRISGDIEVGIRLDELQHSRFPPGHPKYDSDVELRRMRRTI